VLVVRRLVGTRLNILLVRAFDVSFNSTCFCSDRGVLTKGPGTDLLTGAQIGSSPKVCAACRLWAVVVKKRNWKVLNGLGSTREAGTVADDDSESIDAIK
jgi:hypothetical protein